MNPISVLHNAARHYCGEQAAQAHREYADLIAAGRERSMIRAGSWSHTDEASGTMNWMVYASHESSITFGGSWLIEGMRRCLPLFDKYLYRGWDLAAYESQG